MRRRLLQTLAGWGAVLALGLPYALWGSLIGLWIPCPTPTLTGLDCPGCGVTRMCLALLRLDFSGAWAANPGLLLLSPLLLWLLLWQTVDYIRTGVCRTTFWRSILGWSLVVLLVGYGVLRNCI